MIKFFRHIRQKLLAENRFRKYLIYAIGEIILVVIGILLALQINTWKEKQERIKSSNKALVELLKEVRTTKALIQKKNKTNLEAASIMKRYLEDSYINPNDSIKNRVVGYSFAYVPLQLSIPTIKREIGTSGIIIDEEELILELQEFQNLLFVVNQQRFYLDNYWDRNLITFLKEQGLMLSFVSKAGKIDRSVDGMERLYDSEKFKDLVAMEYFHVEAYAEKVTQLELVLRSIEKRLENLIHEYGD